MDSDLSHEALARFEKLEARVTALESAANPAPDEEEEEPVEEEEEAG